MPTPKRTSNPESRLRSGDDKHSVFTQWSKDRGVEIYGVKPASIPGRGFGLVAAKQLRDGDRILFIPERAMFKPNATFLKEESLKHASPQNQLALSAILAFGHADSRMRAWMDTWPTLDDFKENMPMCWSEDKQQMLPPSVKQPLERQFADYSRDWEIASDFCEKYGFDEEEFLYYWLIVNSRSFHWKPPHGKGGSMVMCPFIDYLNHGPTDSTCRVTQSAKGYEVVANRTYGEHYHFPVLTDVPHFAAHSLMSLIEPGEELFATYGPHSNDKLLVHYGFICPHVPNGHSIDDDIRLDHLIIPRLSEEVRDQLQDVGYLGAYALIPTTDEFCFKTQVAVRAILLSCNEWEYFMSCGEDLSVDYTLEVNGFMSSLLAEYRRTAQEYSGAPGMLGLRWTQIVDAIDQWAQGNSIEI